MQIAVQNSHKNLKIITACAVVLITAIVLMRPAIATTSDPGVSAALDEADLVLSLSEEDTTDESNVSADESKTISNDETLLVAANASTDDATYQWQLYDFESESWVDLYGETSILTSIYSAKIVNAQDSSKTALLRAKVQEKGTKLISDVLAISLHESSNSFILSDENVEDSEDETFDDDDLSELSGIKEVVNDETVSSNSDKADDPTNTKDSISSEESLIMAASLDDDDDDFDNVDDIENDTSVGALTASDDGLNADNAETVSSQYTATVKFVNEYGELINNSSQNIKNPYIVEYPSQGELSSDLTNVLLPSIDGYVPTSVTYVDKDGSTQNYEEFSAEDTSFNLPTTLSYDITYIVNYAPSNATKYTINFKFQALNSALSSEQLNKGEWLADEKLTRTFTLYGTTGSTLNVNIVKKIISAYNIDTSGFALRTYDTSFMEKEIAADGSTQLDVQFDRVYYRISYKLNGGTGINDAYVQYGESVIVEDPSYEGKNFKGWYTDAQLTQSAEIVTTTSVLDDGSIVKSTTRNGQAFTMPAQALSFYAAWENGSASYTVSVFVEDPEWEEGVGTEDNRYIYLTGSNEFSNVTTGMELEVVENFAIPENDTSVESVAKKEISNYLANLHREPGDTSVNLENLYYFTLNAEKTKSVTVAGDGSTTLDVYYDRNFYTLRFYYAMQKNNVWYLSSTNNGYSLGSYGTKASLSAGCRWDIALDSEPTIRDGLLTTKVVDGNEVISPNRKGQTLSSGQETIDNYKFLYLDLRAKYNSDISSLWPQEGSVTGVSGSSKKAIINWGTYYYNKYCIDNTRSSKSSTSGSGEPNISYYESMNENIILVEDSQTRNNTSGARKYTATNSNTLTTTTITNSDATTSESIDYSSGPYTHGLVAYSSDGKTQFEWTYKYYIEADESTEGAESHTYSITDESGAETEITKYYVLDKDITQEGITSTQNKSHASYQPSIKKFGFDLDDKVSYRLSTSDGVTTATEITSTDEETSTNYTYELHSYYSKKTFSITLYNGFNEAYLIEGIPWGVELSTYAPKTVTLIKTDSSSESVVFHTNDDGSISVHSATNSDTTDTSDGNVTLGAIEPPDLSATNATWLHTHQFDGYWYALWDDVNNTGDGEAYDFDQSLLMPMSNLILYPGWIEKTYTVNYYLGTPDEPGSLYATDSVCYGDVIDLPIDPVKTDSKFLHWHYAKVLSSDGAGQTTENSSLTPIVSGDAFYPQIDTKTTVINVYAHWDENKIVQYSVRYVLVDSNGNVQKNEDGSEIEVAEATAAEGVVGKSVTVYAKVGSELYAQYQGTDSSAAAFPDKISSSLTLQNVDSNADASTVDGSSTNATGSTDSTDAPGENASFAAASSNDNTYTFYYTQSQPVTYAIKYIALSKSDNSTTGYTEKLLIRSSDSDPFVVDESSDASSAAKYSKIATTNYSVVAVQAESIDGYTLVASPSTGEYQNELSLALTSSSEDDILDANTVSFYYAKNDDAVKFVVNYYLQTADISADGSESYALNRSESDYGLIGTNVKLTPSLIAGYRFSESPEADEDGDIFTGVLTADNSVVINLYYRRAALTVQKTWNKDFSSEDIKEGAKFSLYTISTSDDSLEIPSAKLYEQVGELSTFSVKPDSDTSYVGTTTLYLPILEELNQATGELVSTGRYVIFETSGGSANSLPVYTNTSVAYNSESSIEESIKITQNAYIDGALRTVGAVTFDTDNEDSAGTGPLYASVYVTNYPTYTLQSTGGQGTYFAYAIGGLLLFAAALMLRRLHKTKAERRAS